MKKYFAPFRKSFSMKSPSKYISLSRLLQIKKDNYLSETGLEFCPFEVEELIISKKMSLAASQLAAIERWEKSCDRLAAAGLAELIQSPPLVQDNTVFQFIIRY